MQRNILALFLLLCGCGEEPSPQLSRDELLRPESCKDCHPDHYREWSGSMHAYAADDPVFLAMNARGQRETQGALGDFCVRCHAPMAVAEGATTDGLNLDQIPQQLKGITCYFCHTVESVEGTHNNPLKLSGGTIMRGGIADPKANEGHESAYSSLHDRKKIQSSDLCGSCHDVVTPAGIHLERSYLEWKESLFGQNLEGRLLNCNQCHMTGRDGPASSTFPNLTRRVHAHTFPAIDIALTPWPEMEAQKIAIQKELDPTLQAELCAAAMPGFFQIDVTLDNLTAGHSFPSGAAQDRRVWLELIAYSGNQIIFQSGVTPDNEAITALADPNLWLLRDWMHDEMGNEVHMFWEAKDIVSEVLEQGKTSDPSKPGFFHAKTRSFKITNGTPDRITMRVRVQPIGLDVLDKLIESGDLAPEFRSKMPTFELAGTKLEWTAANGTQCIK